MRWMHAPIDTTNDRYVLRDYDGDSTSVRIIKYCSRPHWIARFPDGDGMHEKIMPDGLTLKQMQDLTLALWRMR